MSAVSSDAGANLATGYAALKSGQWLAARDTFQQALDADGDLPEASFGLALALWWLGDMQAAIEHMEQAYVAFRRRPDPAPAAACALRIGFHYRAHLADTSAASGWLALASRLIEDHRIAPLRGELLLMKAYHAGDPVAGERLAREALEIGRTSGNRDLLLCALSVVGTSLVDCGRIEAGLPLLDEAMAGCLGGEAEHLDTVVFTCCNTLVCCVRCAEFERASQWVRGADRFTERHECPLFHAQCRAIDGRILVACGDWGGAEAALKTAIGLSQDVPAYRAEALAALAGLRVAQGRLEEAGRLVDGIEDHHVAAPVVARIHLRQGNVSLAALTAERHLDALGENRLESAPLIEVLGETALARREHRVADARGAALLALGARLGCTLVVAQGDRLLGCARAASDAGAAQQHLDRALAEFARLGMRYDAARTRRAIAESLRDDKPDVAEREARAALAIFADLGAAADADETVALLRHLGVKAAPPARRALATLTRREQEIVALVAAGLSNPEIAQRLFVSRKTVEHHVARVLAKLGLRSRAEMAAEAVRLGSG